MYFMYMFYILYVFYIYMFDVEYVFTLCSPLCLIGVIDLLGVNAFKNCLKYLYIKYISIYKIYRRRLLTVT